MSPHKGRRTTVALNNIVDWYPTDCLADGAPASDHARYAADVSAAAGDLLSTLGVGSTLDQATAAAWLLMHVESAKTYGRARRGAALDAHVADDIVDRDSRQILREEGHHYMIAGDPTRALVHAMRGVVFLQDMASKAANRNRDRGGFGRPAGVRTMQNPIGASGDGRSPRKHRYLRAQ